ncbi:stage V sporulation protein B [Parageobacillus toebii NBRC 107807]|uniref:Stage V sporulation protein B n=1 Tax=Parageobacillus toebii NBRC 107807 TaxID=1223503 RepID=A0A6G9IYM3_9BACL|nr:stage V sporulation protein B [Parageobacillus toebii]MBB3867569.1 stage V sporulation protein B [Parageobacillus toebii NBRC 107807]QIQ31538.1 stage V sporulation protein B [Parageobacillus toebii NBRC 107807]WMT19318.1 stage V sporulation protein B [Parageobacillus toebii]
MSKFLQGTMILIVAGLITRALGFVNRIVVARVIGEEGVGLYMMAMPTLVLAITITQMGLPVAISKLVAEAEAVGDRQKVKKILVVSLTITSILSVIFFPTMILLAPFLSRTLFTDPRTYYPLIAIAPVVPIIAVSSVLRGYFQGKQQMKPYAYSQLLEQIVRISLIAYCTKALLPYGIEYAAAGAMFSSVIGEFMSLLYLLYMFKLKKSIKLRTKFIQYVKAGKETFASLMRIALPTTGSRLIGSLSWFLEPIVVANSLAMAGVATTLATKQYGQLTGYALPLLMLPSFITYSLSTSLVPAISEAMAQKQTLLVEHRIQQAMRLSLVTGGLSVVVLYVFAEPLMQLMYGTSEATIFVKVMAPFFLFYYFQGPLQAVLQALDLAKAAMTNSLIGAAVKIVCIFALATQPSLGIMGAALAVAINTVLVTLLHFATIIKVVSYSIYPLEYVKACLSITIAGVAGYVSFHYSFIVLPLPIRTLASITVTAIVYLLLLIIFQLVKREELAHIPAIGAFFAKKNRK